ncbi:MAG: glutamate--tRNA ligase [Acholeplasmatales bacterium]|jgi:glutamyl-tRNA synthetase|uniref:glutamate--tRNA ligase n=1 Tax=Thomasclavelia cocleata TaxID=69824 RepID=UPI00257308AA|nr:glutamate--tRNA ligase [Thomasclavelia cocleata]MCI9182076.1 glutamate--tRNA ligase [Acholeplasmatales bacterium]MCI9653659.1 glutamate--tRNA ligase [Acholeplasmatales bacterium]
MATLKDLANLIYPNIHWTLEDLEKRFPKRNLPEGAKVIRFAPSPTGFLHTGSLFASLVGYYFAQQSKGIFYIRLEDTDTKREIEGSGSALVEQLKEFDIIPDEGYFSETKQIGNYGPYKQSERSEIYNTCIKHLIEMGRAYPCFCSAEELQELRKEQEARKEIPGYYGKYAKYRDYPVDAAIEKIKAGVPYIIRFKSMGNHENKVAFHDEIKGDIELTENDQDIVICKSDGLPTYHFAHLVDDHFMRTTHVTRGEEWLPSLPIHIELFDTIGFERPKYAHIPNVMKVDENGTRRKLSKRKDEEAAVSYFLEQGYPKYGFIEYLLTIANSNYEAWRDLNLEKDYKEFPLSFEKMAVEGALFDIAKVANISKERMAYKKAKDLALEVKAWAKLYDKNFYNHIIENEDLFISILNIEREKEKPRKDYEKYSDIYPIISFFYRDVYDAIDKNNLDWNPLISKEDIRSVLQDYHDTLDLSLDEEAWFASIKELAVRHGFADNVKLWKKNKEDYKGHVGDVSEFLRIALSGRKNSPNLYYVIQILGEKEVKNRIETILKHF